MNRQFDGSRRMNAYGSTSRPQRFDSVWDSPVSSQMTPREKLKILEMERTRVLEREKIRMLERERAKRDEHARLMELKQQALVMEQEKAIMLERQKLKMMEEEMERMRGRPNKDGRFVEDYQSSLGSTNLLDDDLRRMPSYSARNALEKDGGFLSSPPRSRIMNDQRGRDIWDGRREKAPFERTSASWTGNQGLHDGARKRDLDFEMQRSSMSEKKVMRGDSFVSKRRKVQDDWSLPKRGNFYDGPSRDSFGNRAERSEKAGFSKDTREPMFNSPTKSRFLNKNVPLAKYNAVRGPSRTNMPSSRATGFRSNDTASLGVNRRLDQGIPVNRTPVWDTANISSEPELSPLLLRSIEQQTRKLIQEEQQKAKRFLLPKGRDAGRNIAYKAGDRPKTGPGGRFQGSWGKKQVQVKRLDSAYNKKFPAKPPLKGNAQTSNYGNKSGTGSNASKTTPVKKNEIKKATDALKLLSIKPKKPFYCIFCKVQYKNKDLYGAHLPSKKHKGEVGKIEKILIDNMFEINKITRAQTRGAKNKKVCTTCCQEFIGNYQKHCQSDIHKLKLYKLGVPCDLCNQTFPRRYILDRHLASLQHARNLGCSLREKGKYEDAADDLKFPEAYDGKSLGLYHLKDVKAFHCCVCDISSIIKGDEVTVHCKTKEHYENAKKYKEKVLAEKKAKVEKVAAEKKAKEEERAAEKKARAEKLAAEKKAKAEKLAAEKKVKAEKIAAEKKVKEEKIAAERKATAEAVEAEIKAQTLLKTEIVVKDQSSPKKTETVKKESLTSKKESAAAKKPAVVKKAAAVKKPAAAKQPTAVKQPAAAKKPVAAKKPAVEKKQPETVKEEPASKTAEEEPMEIDAGDA